MLRKIRILFAVICFSLITLLFLDFTGTLHAWFGWLANVQFLPAVLALNVGVVTSLIVLTLIFGRIYCSVVCPLGVFQDIVSWISGHRKRKKHRFSYSPALTWIRYGMLVLFLMALSLGIGAIVALFAPYSAYGRIASNLFTPFYQWANNLLALFAEHLNSYAFYSVDVYVKSLSVFVVAILTFVILAILAWRNGRTYCNTVCPVGTVLGSIARFSWLKPVIDTSKCNGCGLCARSCKAACINSKQHRIDYSRCVACMDCVGTCKQNAIHYIHPKKDNATEKTTASSKTSNEQVDNGRRQFLTTTTVLATVAVAKAQEKKVDGGLAIIENKKIPNRSTPIVPPGAQGLRHMATHCTGCQLCVSVCPNGVLRPSTKLTTFMQPESSYERGYCRPECTKCSEVCPAGAILKITPADKSAIQVGHAVWIKENCIPLTDGVECGNCARHCPTGAILMIASDSSDPESLKVPVVNTERCIGCGACENLCPARPFSAIYVEGHQMHKTI